MTRPGPRSKRLAGVALLACLAAAGAAAAQEVLAARTLRSGIVVTPSDLKPDDGAGPEALKPLVGLETQKVIYAGRPVRPGDLGPPTLVRRNDLIAIFYHDGGLTLRADGRALDAGGAGERIRVINLGSRQVVQAVVTVTGSAEVRR